MGGNVGTVLVPLIAFGWPLFYCEWEHAYVRIFLQEVLTMIYNHEEGEGDVYEWLEGMVCVCFCFVCVYVMVFFLCVSCYKLTTFFFPSNQKHVPACFVERADLCSF